MIKWYHYFRKSSKKYSTLKSNRKAKSLWNLDIEFNIYKYSLIILEIKLSKMIRIKRYLGLSNPIE